MAGIYSSVLKFLGQRRKNPSKPPSQRGLFSTLPCQVAYLTTFCEILRVSSCKMKGVDIFEISTNSGFQLYFLPRFQDPQAFSYRKRLVSASWSSVTQTWAVKPENTWETSGTRWGGEQRLRKPQALLASQGSPRLAREVDKEHSFEPVSSVPRTWVGFEHHSVRMKWIGWHS